MKEIAFSYYAYLTDLIKLWLVFWGIMNFPINKNRKIFISTNILLVIIMLIIGLFSRHYPDLCVNVWTVTVIFSIGFMFEGKFLKKLGYSTLAYIIILFLDTCIVGISSLYADKSSSEIVNYSVMRLVFNSVNIFTIGGFILLKKSKKLNITQIIISKRVYALLFAGAATGVITLAALLVRSNNEATEKARRVMIIVTIVAVICYMAVCLMIVIVTESRDKYKALSTINQNIIESQQRYYTLVNEKQQEIRSLRHEMKNHLSCIYALYQANKDQDLEHYIGQLIETSDLTVDLFDTGNDIVNAILNDAQSKCKKENISLRLSGSFPSELQILQMDLCVIFANLVSNAIEGILRMERDKEVIYYIDLSIKCFKDDIFITIKNPVSNSEEININKLHTSKANHDIHGFGVQNIIERVKRYQGSVVFHCDNNEFLVEIEMKNKH